MHSSVPALHSRAKKSNHCDHVPIYLSDGMYLGREGLTAEKVAKNFEAISDMSNAKAFFMGGEQTGKFFEKATGK